MSPWQNSKAMTADSLKDIVIYGAGGFGMEVAWLIGDINKVKPTWNLLGYIDDDDTKLGEKFYGYDVIGDMKHLEANTGQIAVAIAIGNPKQRKLIVSRLEPLGVIFPALLHPGVIMPHATHISEGSVIAAGSVMTVEILIGCHVHIDSSCTIGHETIIHDYARLNPGVTVAGKVEIGEGAYIGSGATIIQGLKIGQYSVIGAGSVVIRDVEPDTVVVGNPARPIP